MASRADQTGRMRALRAYPAQPCAVCGAPYSKDGANVGRHHADGDRLNNTPENIVFLCKKHHVAAHRALDGKVGGGVRPRVNAMLRDQARLNFFVAERLRGQGVSTAQIADELGVNRRTVTRWFTKYAKETTP